MPQVESPNASVLPEWVVVGADVLMLRTYPGGAPFAYPRNQQAQPHPVPGRITEAFPFLGIVIARLRFPFFRGFAFRVSIGGELAGAGVTYPLAAGVTDRLVPADSPEAAQRSATLDAALVAYTRENNLRWLGANVESVAI